MPSVESFDTASACATRSPITRTFIRKYYPNKKNHSLTIYDYQGKIVQNTNNITTDKIIIERKELSNGLYLFKLNTDEKIIATGKIIIK